MSTKERASETVGPKSLNVLIRKKENDRIERENQAFAKRLFAKQKEGSLSKKKMDDDFVNYMKYKKQIMKVPQPKRYWWIFLLIIYRLPKFNGRTGTLPPLEDEKDTTRFRSLDDRRSANPTLINSSQSPLIGEEEREINLTKVGKEEEVKA